MITRQSEERRKENEAILIERLKTNFKALSVDALKTSSDSFLKLAETRLKSQTTQHSAELSSKKELIDQ